MPKAANGATEVNKKDMVKMRENIPKIKLYEHVVKHIT